MFFFSKTTVISEKVILKQLTFEFGQLFEVGVQVKCGISLHKDKTIFKMFRLKMQKLNVHMYQNICFQ